MFNAIYYIIPCPMPYIIVLHDQCHNYIKYSMFNAIYYSITCSMPSFIVLHVQCHIITKFRTDIEEINNALKHNSMN